MWADAGKDWFCPGPQGCWSHGARVRAANTTTQHSYYSNGFTGRCGSQRRENYCFFQKYVQLGVRTPDFCLIHAQHVGNTVSWARVTWGTAECTARGQVSLKTVSVYGIWLQRARAQIKRQHWMMWKTRTCTWNLSTLREPVMAASLHCAHSMTKLAL